MCTAECSQSFQLKECNYVTVELSLFFDALPWKQESFDPGNNHYFMKYTSKKKENLKKKTLKHDKCIFS